MIRTTLADIYNSRIPALLGYCPGDPRIAATVNEAQQRLINDGGETGWIGGWTKVRFNVSCADPYVTLARPFARAINMSWCRTPFRIQNEFYELLPAGPGLAPSGSCAALDWCGEVEGFDRGFVPTLADPPTTIPTGGWTIRLYWADNADAQAHKRVLVQALDQNGLQIYSQDGVNQVNGFYLTADDTALFVDFAGVSLIQAVTKDVTLGDFILKAVDPVTLTEYSLSRYAPSETKPSYRRYKITKLPAQCCPICATGSTTTPLTVQVTAMCKLEYIPVSVPTDYLIIGNIPALTLECQSIRFEEMDDPAADTKAANKHKQAVRQLQNEMRHYMGVQVPAVSIDRWGVGGQPERKEIGCMR